MADDSEDQQPEIIPKQPSHPITTTLIILQCVGVLCCIIFVWQELFGYYLPSSKGPQDALMSNHTFKATQKMQTPIDHYDLDFKGESGKDGRQQMEYSVRQALHLTAQAENDALFGAGSGK